MAEELTFENERISNFEKLMTLTLDRVILHTFLHHSLTSTYMPNFIIIKDTFCGRTGVRTYTRTDRRTFETQFIRSTQKSRPKNTKTKMTMRHKQQHDIPGNVENRVAEKIMHHYKWSLKRSQLSAHKHKDTNTQTISRVSCKFLVAVTGFTKFIKFEPL